jgi:chorismate mutase
MKPASLFSFLAIASLSLLASCALPSGNPGSGHARRVAQLMTERLSWMDDVAAVKQARGLPITDAKREALLLQAMEKQGTTRGIPTAASRAFFVGQMAAARQYQGEWLAQHPNHQVRKLPDLAKDIRPELDRISAEMLAELAALRASHVPAAEVTDAATKRLARSGYSLAVAREASAGLKAALEQ